MESKKREKRSPMSELTLVHLITFNSIWSQRHNLDGESIDVYFSSKR